MAHKTRRRTVHWMPDTENKICKRFEQEVPDSYRSGTSGASSGYLGYLADSKSLQHLRLPSNHLSISLDSRFKKMLLQRFQSADAAWPFQSQVAVPCFWWMTLVLWQWNWTQVGRQKKSKHIQNEQQIYFSGWLHKCSFFHRWMLNNVRQHLNF